MRKYNTSFYFNLYNLRSLFGDHTTRLLKDWIDFNYRFIRVRLKINFLPKCKQNNLFQTHLQFFSKHCIRIFHYKTVRKLNNLIDLLKSKVLKVELFDLYRSYFDLKYKISRLSFNLSNSFPLYI